MVHEKSKKPELEQSEVIEEMPLACSTERAAVEFFEAKRWGDCPCCPHCGDTDVYTMKDRKTGDRNKDFRWRCRGCGSLYSVRTGMIFEESLIPLHKWARAIWEAASGKNGVSALEISRKCQISYKSALFVMHRLRHAMADDFTSPPKLTGTIECDETYIGGKPRYRGKSKRGRGTKKQPVVAVLQRGGIVRTRVIPVVNAENVKTMIRENVAKSARICTDSESSYRGIGAEYRGGHHSVNHGAGEYVRGDVTTNAVEGFFARVKRGMKGVYHNVSREHLFRYMDQFEFAHNTRKMNDGERVLSLIDKADGKRLRYREPGKKAG
ncbi:MAG: IS1595 family transposase [Phycisphaeraceae bacterium]|nr:IS1595 family transposase [Phycisphaeraceae bacterium]